MTMAITALYRMLWRAGQVLAAQLGVAWWSTWYNLWATFHPAVERQGWVRVTGRVDWRVHPAGRLVLGRRVRINSGSRINAVGGHRPMVIAVLRGAELVIGDDVGLSSSTLVCACRIEVGRRALVGGDCRICDSDFHSTLPEDRLRLPDPGVKVGAVRIGAGAFLGTGATILKGVMIGERAVIGAGAVVTRSVPASEMWAGNPARRIGLVPPASSSS